MSKNQTMLVWSGVSELDGVTPIIALASFDSANVKTGNMVQISIIVEGIKPTEALKSGADAAVCGSCIHRGDAAAGKPRTCYVNLRSVNSPYGAYTRGNTRPLDLTAFEGRKVRFGTYGDPAAVPTHVWQQIAAVCDGYTGYTHQWRAADPRLAEICMASCDSDDDYRAARKAGWRGFVPREVGAPKPKGLVQCPATEGKDNAVTCITCMQCSGTGAGRTASISIEVHGAAAKHFRSLPLSVA